MSHYSHRQWLVRQQITRERKDRESQKEGDTMATVMLKCCECGCTETALDTQQINDLYKRWTVHRAGSMCPPCSKEWTDKRQRPLPLSK